jgi:hypothetical protein
MAVTTTNLIQGPATMYIGLFGATEPTDATINTAPGTGWTDVGGTDGGVTVTATLTIDPLSVDQVLEIPGDIITGRNVTVATNMAEPTLINYARAWNLNETTAITTGTSPVGPIFEPASDVTAFAPIYHSIILDGLAPGGFKRRIILRRAIQTGAVGMAYQKAGQTFVPVTWRNTYVSSSIKPFRVLDAIA